MINIRAPGKPSSGSRRIASSWKAPLSALVLGSPGEVSFQHPGSMRRLGKFHQDPAVVFMLNSPKYARGGLICMPFALPSLGISSTVAQWILTAEPKGILRSIQAPQALAGSGKP